jgi:ABC-type sugar transport system permease subunit
MATVTGTFERPAKREGGGLLGWLGRQPPGRMLVLPALIYAIVITQGPFLLTVWYSFQQYNLNRPTGAGSSVSTTTGSSSSATPPSARRLPTRSSSSSRPVVISLLLGLLFAELVNHKFPGRNVVRTLLITPFLVMPAAAALTWKNMMLNPIFGVISWLYRTVIPGSTSRPTGWGVPGGLGRRRHRLAVGAVHDAHLAGRDAVDLGGDP